MRQALINEMEMKGLKSSYVAKQVGTSPSNLTSFFSKGKEIAFDTVLEIVRYLLPEKETDLMKEYSESVYSPKGMRYALEYNSTHRNLDTLKKLSDRAMGHSNVQLKETGRMYSLIHTWQTDTYENEMDLYSELRSMCVSDKNMKILQALMECLIFQGKKEYKVVKAIAEMNKSLVDSISEDFLKRSFKARLLQMLVFIEVKVNCDYEKAKILGKELADCKVGNSYSGYANYLLGLSQLFINYEESLGYFDKAKKHYAKAGYMLGVKAMSGNIFVLDVVWGRVTNIEIQNHLNHQIDDYRNSGLGLFLNGLATGNKELLYSSLTKMMKQADNMLATLPRLELLRQGENEEHLNRLQELSQSA